MTTADTLITPKMGDKFSNEDLNYLENIFSKFAYDKNGYVLIEKLPELLSSFDQDTVNVKLVQKQISHLYPTETKISFNQLVTVLENSNSKANDFESSHNIIPPEVLDDTKLPNLSMTDGSVPNQDEEPDHKVLEFLKILEEYRVKCEEEGNYLEAGRAYKQLTMLRKQEEKRQQKIIKMKQLAEREEIQNQQNKQYEEFNVAWDKYMDDYDKMAQQYILQMTERHALALLELQEKLRQEVLTKPPRFSKELIDMRRKQITAARNKQYKEAEQLKKVCDQMEEREMNEMEQVHAVNFARREAKFRIQQQAELQALLKRIEGRRKEHIKQKHSDSKRLLQRNRNIQATLESQHALDQQKLFDHLKKQLNAITPTYNEDGPANLRSLNTTDKEVSIILDKKRKDTIQQNNLGISGGSNDNGTLKGKSTSKESFLPHSLSSGNQRHSATDASATRKKESKSNVLPSTSPAGSSVAIGATSPRGRGSVDMTAEESTNGPQLAQDPPFLHSSAPQLNSDGNIHRK